MATDTNETPSTPQPPRDPSLKWVIAFGGLALAGLAGFVVYQTLTIFASGSADWLECLRGTGVALGNCGEQLDLAYDYRYGVDALQALGAALLLAFVGPLPMITVLSRYRNNTVGAILFFLILFPYGLLAFLLVFIGTIIVIFYGVELT